MTNLVALIAALATMHTAGDALYHLINQTPEEIDTGTLIYALSIVVAISLWASIVSAKRLWQGRSHHDDEGDPPIL